MGVDPSLDDPTTIVLVGGNFKLTHPVSLAEPPMAYLSVKAILNIAADKFLRKQIDCLSAMPSLPINSYG